jgi:hypothetical protein
VCTHGSLFSPYRLAFLSIIQLHEPTMSLKFSSGRGKTRASISALDRRTLRVLSTQSGTYIGLLPTLRSLLMPEIVHRPASIETPSTEPSTESHAMTANTQATPETVVTQPISANDNADPCAPSIPILERDLEGVIVAAATGDTVAKQLLRTVVYRIALDALLYVEDAKRVAKSVLNALGDSHLGLGEPLPGRAVKWLENVTRTYARYDRERARRKQWEEWDAPVRDPEEKGGDDSES